MGLDWWRLLRLSTTISTRISRTRTAQTLAISCKLSSCGQRECVMHEDQQPTEDNTTQLADANMPALLLKHIQQIRSNIQRERDGWASADEYYHQFLDKGLKRLAKWKAWEKWVSEHLQKDETYRRAMRRID